MKTVRRAYAPVSWLNEEQYERTKMRDRTVVILHKGKNEPFKWLRLAGDVWMVYQVIEPLLNVYNMILSTM